MRTRKMRIDPAAVYVCWMSTAWSTYVVQRGQRLRGDHPAVQHLGADAFVPDGTLESEAPSRWLAASGSELAARAAEAPPESAAPPRIPASTPLSALWVCNVAVVASSAGPCPEGWIVAEGDPWLTVAPDAFVPLANRVGNAVTPLMVKEA